MMRTARPGPGNGWRHTISVGQSELLADTPHLVLEQLPQRLDELHHHVVGQAADIVVRLDPRGDARLSSGLDHIGVERSLDEEAHVAETGRLLLEDADEVLADPPPLLLRIGDPFEAGEEAVGRIDVRRARRGNGRRTS